MVRIERSSGTIVARATPEGRGAVGVIRISGPEARFILESVFQATGCQKEPIERRMRCGWLIDPEGRTVDQVLATWMPGPRSFTGEDVVEIHCHGGDAVMTAALCAILARGARLARPGEFSYRAFLAGKIDLSQAEAIMAMVSAANETEVRGAARALQGDFSRSLGVLREKVLEALAAIEAGIDFSDEPETQAVGREALTMLIGSVEQACKAVRIQHRGCFEVVVSGPCNVGKSTLVNALTGRETSIVTPEAGTTRDAVTASVLLDGTAIDLVDTAGLDQRPPTGAPEREAARVAKQRIESADLVLWITDRLDGDLAPDVPHPRVLRLLNKIDLWEAPIRGERCREARAKGLLPVSAKNREGLEQLEECIAREIHLQLGPADGILATDRQRSLLDSLNLAVQKAEDRAHAGQMELAADHLQEGLDNLDQILGTNSSDDVLSRIFDTFCVGK